MRWGLEGAEPVTEFHVADEVALHLAQASAFQLHVKHTRNPALAAQHWEKAKQKMDAAQGAVLARNRIDGLGIIAKG